MDINFDKIKSVLTVVIAIGSGMFSLYLTGKNYLETSFVPNSTYERMKDQMTLNYLENRKYSLENRIYFLNMCMRDTKCPFNTSSHFEVTKAARDLDDVRGEIEILRKKIILE